jgi:hypothetical protein
MDFLKKIGLAINAGTVLVPYLSPLIKGIFPSTAPVVQNINDELPAFAKAAAQIEAIGATLKLQGEQKLQILIPQIGQVVASSSVVLGKKIKDKALYEKAVLGYAQATVDLLKSIDPDEVDKVSAASHQWNPVIPD